MVDTLTTLKLRALSVSESFLSGEACLDGSTLVPTVEHGLVRIADLVAGEHKAKEMIPLSVTVGSRYKKLKTVGWQYNGNREALSITTKSGNNVVATSNHPLLVLNSDMTTDWVRTDKIKYGDVLCVSTDPVVRKRKLQLGLSDHVKYSNSSTKSNYLTKPKVMTPDLAYFLGAFIAEGSFGNKGRAVCIPNCDSKFLKGISGSFESVFGIALNYRAISKKGTAYKFANGSSGKTTKDAYQLDFGSDQLIKWLEEIGVYYTRGKKTSAHYKDIPWSILQADVESQYAFLAAYLEGDGSIRAGRMS